MKKGLIYFTLAILSLQACRKNDEEVQPSITEQNNYDDQAITKFMNDHYFDERGNVTPFSETDDSDDNEPKLSSYNPVKLPSGVVYILRPNAQPNPGKAIGNTDILELMGTAYSYLAKKEDGAVKFTDRSSFMNTINTNGDVYVDPIFYYVKEEKLTDNRTRSFFEIEGFQEGIRHFKSCEIDNEENYNLQGVIFVPSRAGYARDENMFSIPQNKFEDRSFIFNIQVYKTTERPTEDE